MATMMQSEALSASILETSYAIDGRLVAKVEGQKAPGKWPQTAGARFDRSPRGSPKPRSFYSGRE